MVRVEHGLWVARLGVLVGLAGMLIGCAAREAMPARGAEEAAPASFAWVEVAPGLRVDVAAGVVEFDGEIATDVHHPETPTVWLELFVTGPDSREHESLVVTRVPASLLHAALLSVGAEPGAPARVWVDDAGVVQREDATGTPLEVVFVTETDDGVEREHEPASWVRHDVTGQGLHENPAWGGFVFAGSEMREYRDQPVYVADQTGVIVTLTSFGHAVIAPTLTLSHQTVLDEAVWIARNEVVPTVGTPVRVRVRPIGLGE